MDPLATLDACRTVAKLVVDVLVYASLDERSPTERLIERMEVDYQEHIRRVTKHYGTIKRIYARDSRVRNTFASILAKATRLKLGRARLKYFGSAGLNSAKIIDTYQSMLLYTDAISSRVTTGGKRRQLLGNSREVEAESPETIEGLSTRSGPVRTDCGVCGQFFYTFERFGPSPTQTNSPFYDFGNSTRPLFDKMEALKIGGSSEVYSATMNHCRGRNCPFTKQHHYVVKKLNSGSFQDYYRERDAYKKLRLVEDPHQHIVPLLASYRMGGKYHLIFPAAECDLATYWRLASNHRIGKEGLQWFGSQMRGLADAVSTVHGNKSTEGQPLLHGVHGDIKPENILCFGGVDKWTSFALKDFGSSYFLPPEQSNHVPKKGLKHTPVYRAPEVDCTSEGVTQAYDIWSLGCVFAEAVAWFFGGKAGIARLAEARFDQEENSPNRDAFFRLIFERQGGRTAQLKPGVQGLLLFLRKHPRSTPFIEDLIDLVENKMLRIDTHDRMTSHDIFNALSEMCERLENDSTYSEPRGGLVHDDAEMALSFHTPYSTARSTSLTTSGFQVHTSQNARQPRGEVADANYQTNTTTQSFSEAGNQGLKPRFPCPFYKAGIRVSEHHLACEGPGWTTISKVKEHLFRVHLPKNYKGKHICRRCDSSFETDELLLAHQKQEPPCLNKNPEPVYGMITREQAARFGSLKRKSTKVTDEDRWFDIYRIIFPGYNGTDNISPYHESNSTSLSTLNSTTTTSNGISQYKDYLRERDVEEYAAKLAGMGITVTLEVAAKLLEVQVRDIETFDETMREPVRTYGIAVNDSHEKREAESSGSILHLGSSDLHNQS